MYAGNNNINYPAVPSLYPMDPCRPAPQSTPHPMPQPYSDMPSYSNMPMCPMMNPMFRECVRVCMMQCGDYPMPMDYTMNMNYYTPINSTDINESYPYYYEEKKE